MRGITSIEGGFAMKTACRVIVIMVIACISGAAYGESGLPSPKE